MTKPFVFVDRRKGGDRRLEQDPCRDMDMDLYHRKRRKSKDRRSPNRSLMDDYYAYMQKTLNQLQNKRSSAKTTKGKGADS